MIYHKGMFVQVLGRVQQALADFAVHGAVAVSRSTAGERKGRNCSAPAANQYLG